MEQAGLAQSDQALADLRQQLGYESVPAEYDVTGPFEYQPLTVRVEDLQAKALSNRPDLRAAQLGITYSGDSQYQLAKSNGKQDVTFSSNYSHVNGLSSVTFSVSAPLPIFDRNLGNIAQTRYASTLAQEQLLQARGQVIDDVKDAYVGSTVQRLRGANLSDRYFGRRKVEPRSQRLHLTSRRDRPSRCPGRPAQLRLHRTCLPTAACRLPDVHRAASPGGRNQELAVSPLVSDSYLATKDEPIMKREQVRARIAEIGIIPSVRLHSAADALFAAEAICSAGIPIVEVTTTVLGAVDVIRELVSAERRRPSSAPGRFCIAIRLPLPRRRRCEVSDHDGIRLGHRQHGVGA